MHRAGLALLLVLHSAASAQAGIDPAAAARAFTEFEALCTHENTALWGEQLCGPLMLVSRDGEILTNRPAVSLERTETGLYRGTLPEGISAANTATEWSGVRWTQMLWPLPEDARERGVLMAHEAFHRIQPALGMTSAEGDNSHLDTFEGRLWLRLESKALERALEYESEWREAARDALLFRSVRLEKFPNASANECAIIRNEGLAEYTGARAGAGGEAKEVALNRLVRGVERPSFVRTLGYIVGPAYGLLLDRAGCDWRTQARGGGCPSELLHRSIGMAADAEERAETYGFAGIDAEERAREHSRREMLARFNRTFVEGPVLVVPFTEMRISFSPNRVTAFQPHGTVYTQARVRDVWGHTVVEGDLLMAPDRRSMRLPAPIVVGADSVTGPGWEMTLNPGHEVRPAERAGDFILVEIG